MVAAWALAALLAACRGAPPLQEQDAVARLVDSLKGPVERAVGLRFTHTPNSATRSRQQVRAYLRHQLDEVLPPERARGMQTAYRLLGLLPDTLELRALLLDLYTEQVVGYYEPDSSTLFVVAGSDPHLVQLTLAHEMVHALQHQHTPIDSIMHQTGDNDRLSAAQAILEGQATLASLQVIVPTQNIIAMPEFWETYREQVKAQQSNMAVFGKAPRLVREELIFPYLAGADFMRWWAGSEHRDTVPLGRFMPTSTEQILHPERYGKGDEPITVRFRTTEKQVIYEDVFGEFEIRVLAADLSGAAETMTPLALGWGGDRYRVYDSPVGPAMVWFTVWDDSVSAEKFRSGPAAALAKRRRLGYRLEVTPFVLDRRPAVRVVIAPAKWDRWKDLPIAVIGDSSVVNDSLPLGAGKP